MADPAEQVKAATEESDLTSADLAELDRLLDKLQDELEIYHATGDLRSLGGTGYKRVVRAPSGITEVKRYIDWRERQREDLE